MMRTSEDVFDQQDTINDQRRLFMAALALGGAALGGNPVSAEAVGQGPLSRRMEQRIDHYIKGLRRRGVIPADERTAWSVYDFTLKAKLVSINEDYPRQSASMIKPFVAQAYFYRTLEQPGRFRYTHRVRTLMEAMIRHSDNSATNYFIDRVGEGNPRNVERVLKRRAPGIFRQTRIVERIPSGGRTYRNLASARDYSRYLYALWHETLPNAREIKHLMGLPNRDRLYHGPNNTATVYDKTGTTARLCGNMGIIAARGRDGREYPYTFIAIIEKTRRASNYYTWSRHRGSVIREVSNLVYQDLKATHRLI
ncbi:MAG: serine hydrolase [Candidatus Competibacterales bacterium]